jgi:hypothetical protein
MSNNNDNNRVLGRLGARELSEQEVQQVTGAIIRHCTFNPLTCAMDGICSPPPAC